MLINYKLIIVSFFIIILVLALFFAFRIERVYILKEGDDFNLDEKLLLEHLKIRYGFPLLLYNVKNIENKILKFSFFEKATVRKKLPNSLIIKIKMKEPVAYIYGKDNNIFLLDKEGFVYKNAFKNFFDLPLILSERKDLITTSITLKGVYKNVITTLAFLRDKKKDIFASISQIEIRESKNDYILYYKRSKTGIYLKNSINVDAIIKGLAAIKVLEDDTKMLYFVESGFLLL